MDLLESCGLRTTACLYDQGTRYVVSSEKSDETWIECHRDCEVSKILNILMVYITKNITLKWYRIF